MAWIWHMTANVGSEDVAKAFVKRFDRSPFTLPHAGPVDLRLGIDHPESGWEVGILPYVQRDGEWRHLNDHGGASEPREVEDINACATVLYDRLRELCNYRFALTGFEVGGWCSAGVLLDDLSPGGGHEDVPKLPGWAGLEGLVVMRELYEAALAPEGFTRFSSGFYWVPLTSIASNP